MEEFYLKVYLFKPNRVPPIKIAKDSQLKITIETMDYTIPGGATASAFATGVTSEKVYTQRCTVSGNKVSFTPVPGFFVQGRNLLQYEIGGGVIPLAIDVNCEISLPSTGETGEPETVKPLVQRAEAAAATAEEKANAAAGSAGSAAGSAKAANDAFQKTQEISINPAYIGENGNWYVWSAAADAYVDSGVKAQGPKGDPGAVQTVCGVAPDASGNVALTAENVGAATKGYVDASVRKATPRNLLDNSDFRNPVNQRGFSSTTSSAGIMCIDRWEFSVNSGGIIRLTNDGLVCDNANLMQKIAPGIMTSEKQYYLVLLRNDGTYIRSTWIDFDHYGDGSNATRAVFSNVSGTFVAAALYEGEYTAETLPEYQPKGYGAELAECQRYCYVINPTKKVYAPIGFALGFSDKKAFAIIPLPVPMRVNPSVSFSGSFEFRGIKSHTVSKISLDKYANDSTIKIGIDISDSGITYGEAMQLGAASDGTGQIVLSADL